MIINGGSRSNGGFFARHLMRADDNERVTIADMRGFAYAEDVPDAFRELQDLASGTRCKNYFYHANINTRADERLTPEQWADAVDSLERRLELTGQPRFIVEHEKEGRVHRHVVWGRIDADTMTTIHDGHNYRRHEEAAREIEETHGLEPVQSTLARDKEETPRVERRPADWESFRAKDSRIDPQAVKAELTQLWQHADSGPAFVAAVEERGYILARGDRRDYCIIDQAGDEHSLGRRLAGVKAAELRARMADVNCDALPSVKAARDLARSQIEGDTSAPADAIRETRDAPLGVAQEAAPATPRRVELSPFDAILAERIKASRPADMPSSFASANEQTEREGTAFAYIMAERVQHARNVTEADQADEPGGKWDRFSAWLSTMREHVASLGQQARDYWGQHFGKPEPVPEINSPEGPKPDTSVQVAEAQVEPMQPKYTGPELG